MTLSAAHIHHIKELLAASPISSALMQDDIVDHLCCAVEFKMVEGESFENALSIVMLEFAPNGLCEIERESYLLFNYKSIIMKKYIYAFALLSCMATSFAVIFKVLHLQGANELLTFGLGGMSVFIPLLLFKSGLSAFDRAKSWFGLLSIFFLTVGTLLKLLHLAGANIALLLGVLCFSLGFLPLFFVKLYRESVAS